MYQVVIESTALHVEVVALEEATGYSIGVFIVCDVFGPMAQNREETDDFLKELVVLSKGSSK